MDVFSDNTSCRLTILRIVARGNSIIAELKRLSTAIPNIFRIESKTEMQKYGDVLMDFSYFQSPDIFTKKIESSSALIQLDSTIRDHHLEVVTRIYTVFESIYRYISHLIAFLKDVQEEFYLHLTLDTVFADPEGKQLMCEALYLYGVMLLLTDDLYPGPLRERIIVAHHRHASLTKSSASDANIDDVCRLLRSTGYRAAAKRPLSYPEDYFSRVELPKLYIDQVLGHLRTDDIYNQISAYPVPEHRPVALSNQAAMLFVCLYFSSQILQGNTQKMREIVDRFFPDNWVLSYFMGTTVNLVDVWDGYKAAKQALSNSVESSNVKLISSNHGKKLSSLSAQCAQLESEGVLNETKVLSYRDTLLKLLRECNVTLRWMVLHTAPLEVTGGTASKRCKVIRELVVNESKYSSDSLFDLLLHTSGLELKITHIYRKILQQKNSSWQKYLDSATSTLLELADAFTLTNAGVSRPLARVKPNAKLQKWFSGLAEQLATLSASETEGGTETTSNAMTLMRMVRALDEVKEYHGLSTCGGAIQAVDEISTALQSLIRLSKSEDKDTVLFALVADLSYAWVLVNQFTLIMQSRIKKDPSQVSRIKAVFLKLSTGIELPLLRITQVESQDVLSVSAFYSGKLVDYVRKVLQIIPETMFSLVGEIVSLQTHHLTDLPSKLEKEKLKEYAQLDQRYKVAELFHSVGVLAEGVAGMGETMVGIEKLHPKELLSEGVRRELVKRVSFILSQNVSFSQNRKGAPTSDLVARLSSLSKLLKGFRSSFEYIQDYVNMYALKMWNEEISKLIKQCVEQEQQKIASIAASQSRHSSTVGNPGNSAARCDNFLKRLCEEIIRVTDPKLCTYVWLQATWYDNTKHRNKVLDSRVLFSKVEDAITIGGLAGLDKLFAFRIILTLNEINNYLSSTLDAPTRTALSTLAEESSPNTNLMSDPLKHYAAWLTRLNRVCPQTLVDSVQRVGQLQLLRLNASYRLKASSSFQANYFHEALKTLNISLMNEVKRVDLTEEEKQTYLSDANPLISQLTDFLEQSGLDSPIDRLYVKPSDLIAPHIPYVVFITVLSLAPKLQYSSKLRSVASVKANEGLDGIAFSVGLLTMLKQGQEDGVKTCLALLGQYLASHLNFKRVSGGMSSSTITTAEVSTLSEIIKQWADMVKIGDVARFLPVDVPH